MMIHPIDEIVNGVRTFFMTIFLVDKENIFRQVRRKLRLNQEEFAELLGVNRQRYKHWEYDTATPPPEMLEKVESMAANILRPDEGLKGMPMVKIPVVGRTSAGPGADMGTADDFEVWVPQHMLTDTSTGWVAEGDSMMPWIQPGDVVIAKESPTPRLNYAFLILRDDGTCSVKVLKWKGEEYEYLSLNPRYDPEPARGRLLGYVTGIYRAVGSHESIENDYNGLRPPML
jgi:SOS-response transcriptional repressor LexA